MKKGGTLVLFCFFFFPQWPYLWVSDGGRDVYMNLTQTAWTSWVCKYQAANFMRTEHFFPRIWGRGGGLRFPVIPVLELLEMRQKLYFRISVPGLCWNVDTQMCTKKGHMCTYSLSLTHTNAYLKWHCTYKIFIQNKHTVLSILNNMESSSKTFHKGLSKFQKQTEQQSDLGGKVLFLIILSRVAWSS